MQDFVLFFSLFWGFCFTSSDLISILFHEVFGFVNGRSPVYRILIEMFKYCLDSLVFIAPWFYVIKKNSYKIATSAVLNCFSGRFKNVHGLRDLFFKAE